MYYASKQEDTDIQRIRSFLRFFISPYSSVGFFASLLYLRR